MPENRWLGAAEMARKPVRQLTRLVAPKVKRLLMVQVVPNAGPFQSRKALKQGHPTEEVLSGF